MDNPALKSKRDISGQVTLESVVMFVAILLLAIGTVSLWSGTNVPMVKLQPYYEGTRVSAGGQGMDLWNTTNMAGNVDVDNFITNRDIPPGLDSCPELQLALDEVNNGIKTTEENIPVVQQHLTNWQTHLSEATTGEQQAQTKVAEAEAKLAEAQAKMPSTCPSYQCTSYDECYDECQSVQALINAAQEQLDLARYGGYERTYCSAEGCWTYYELTPTWRQDYGGPFEDREAFAEDYWFWRDYQYTPGGSYHSSWIPGLEDWTARKTHAQEQVDFYQNALDQANYGLEQLKNNKAILEQMLAEMGC